MEESGSREAAGEASAALGGKEEEETTKAQKVFLCSCLRRWIPPQYREELHHLLQLTGPLVLSRILYFLLPFVTTIFCGRIGNAELAGYGIASATINVTTTATGHGLAMACDTLISQTYGSKNLRRVGVILQRSSLIVLLFCLPCWALLLNAHNLLLLMQQEEEVARIAQLYAMAFLPAVPAMLLHQLQGAYLQNQGIILPQMYTAAVANVINLGVNYVLIYLLDWGVFGSAVANSFSQVTICLLLFLYIRWKKLHQETWGGWSTECLQDWGSYMKLAIPSTFMVCFEWWIWEIGGFLAGMLGEEDLAAQHILLEFGAITFMFPLGVHAAACVRVGNALGAGKTDSAITTCKVALGIAGGMAVVQSIVILGSKSVVGYIFTSDVNIVDIVSLNLTVYGVLQFFDALLCVCSGILVGSGMQKIAALSNLLGYYCLGVPVGIGLMFKAKLRILGFWLGLLICIFCELCFFLGIIYKLNWKKLTQQAQLRAGKKLLMTPKRPTSMMLSEGMLPDAPDNTETLTGGDPTVGYSRVSSQDQEMKVSGGPELNNVHKESGKDGEQRKKSKAKTEAQLSVCQLVLRRGLAILVSLLILVVGVSFHFVFPPPEPSARNQTSFSLSWDNDTSLTSLPPTNFTLSF